MGLVVLLGLLLVASALVVSFLRLVRSRARVMEYHNIDTPRINTMTHGGV